MFGREFGFGGRGLVGILRVCQIDGIGFDVVGRDAYHKMASTCVLDRAGNCTVILNNTGTWLRKGKPKKN